MLHSHTELDSKFNELQLTFGAKEQECLTLESHNAIQKQQIQNLQSEITEMCDKLERIKSYYETELE